MRRAILLASLLLASASLVSGCCSSSEDVIVFERSEDDEGLSCEEVCENTVVPQAGSTTYEFVSCIEGASEADKPAVICTFETETCTTELH
jgi:hypothetical protein